MSFDPEKVRRWPEFEQKKDGTFAESGPLVILASDYDKLLEIHLRHAAMIADLFKRCGEPLSEEKIAALKNGTWR